MFASLLNGNHRFDNSYRSRQHSPSEFLSDLQFFTDSFKLIQVLDYNLQSGKPVVFNKNMIKHIIDKFPSLNVFGPKLNHYNMYRINLNSLEPDALSDIEVHDLNVTCNSNGNLVGCPETVHGNFEVYGELTSLKGCPRHIENDFVLNSVTSANINEIDLISDYPDYIGGNLKCPRMGYNDFQYLQARLQRLKSLHDTLPDAENDPELSDLF